jgi:hypothetical protein
MSNYQRILIDLPVILVLIIAEQLTSSETTESSIETLIIANLIRGYDYEKQKVLLFNRRGSLQIRLTPSTSLIIKCIH